MCELKDISSQIGRGQVLLGALQAHEERTDDPTEEKILAGHQVAIDRQLKVAIPAAGQLAAKLEQANISETFFQQRISSTTGLRLTRLSDSSPGTAPQQSSGQSKK